MVNNLKNENIGDLVRALVEAQQDGLGGIILTNDFPESDYKALVLKNETILARWSLLMNRSITLLKDGSVSISMNLTHTPSGQFLNSKSVVRRDKFRNSLEENSPEVFLRSRLLYEGLLGIISSNNEIEAEIYGPTKIIGTKSKKTFLDPFNVSLEMMRRESLSALIGFPLKSYKDIYLSQKIFSWAAIKLFLRCERCFYIQEKLGIRLNALDKLNGLEKVTDILLKKEFDQYRKMHKKHPIMENSNATKPLKHKNLEVWRCAYDKKDDPHGKRGGIQFYNSWENWTVYGGVDDIWLTQDKKLIIVDYKSSTTGKVFPEYKQQIEFYAWIFKQKNYSVSSTGYILMYQPDMNRDTLDWRLDFEPTLHPILIDDTWVEPTIQEAIACLSSDVIPDVGCSAINKSIACELCTYFEKLTLKMNEYQKANHGYELN